MRLEERFWSKVAKAEPSECWKWTAACDKKGYGQFRVICDGKSKKCGAHRVSYELEHKMTLTSEQHILHSCDTPACVNAAHLSVGTNADNMADKVAKGRQARIQGMNQGQAKLTDEQVREIRRKFIGTVLQRELAKEYRVAQQTISKKSSITKNGNTSSPPKTKQIQFNVHGRTNAEKRSVDVN